MIQNLEAQTILHVSDISMINVGFKFYLYCNLVGMYTTESILTATMASFMNCLLAELLFTSGSANYISVVKTNIIFLPLPLATNKTNKSQLQ
jgi:hypothetical protein